MNWDALDASAEAIGAVAILLTLVYLTVQVRQATLASADTNRLMRASGVREMSMALLHDKDLRETVWRAYGETGTQYLADFAERFDVAIEEAARPDVYTQYYLWLHWGQFSTTKTAADDLELKNIVTRFYNVPAFRYAWENSMGTRPVMDAEFVKFIDSVLVPESTGTK